MHAFVGHGDPMDDELQGQTTRRPSALTAFDKMTGAEVWSVTPPFSHDSYMTPLVWTRADGLEVVIATWKTLAGFAASDGFFRDYYLHGATSPLVIPISMNNGPASNISIRSDIATSHSSAAPKLFAIALPAGREFEPLPKPRARR